jgi:[NiFe] hydrogenase assembly HybE family chaperone
MAPRADASTRLTSAFRAAAARMDGLAFVNPALEVEAVGFALWNGRWLGVMVTPWFMNLTLVRADPAAWRPLAVGAKRRYRFPAGDYEFIGAHDSAIGDYQVCSLFSPMQDFADHATARLVAELARAALFDPANAEVHEPSTTNRSPGDAEVPPGPLARLETELGAPMSKRDFVRGRFLGGDRDDRG